MEKTVIAQRKFFDSNATKDSDFRINNLKKFKKVLLENEQLLNDSIHKDFGKSSFENYMTELCLVYADIDTAVKKTKIWSKPKRVRTNLVNFPAKSFIQAEPLGTSLIIGAWNFPFLTSFLPVVAAMAAGNTIILKPSELSKNTSRIMHEIISANFAKNYFSVVEGGVSETTQLLEQRFDKIFFTGSTAVGKIVYAAASKHLTPVSLELGGKNPTFVTESCHLKTTIKRLVWAKFLNAGQACLAPDYILVHSSIKKIFMEMLKIEIERSEFSIENGNYVHIISENHTQRLINFLDDDKIYCGGKHDIANRYVEPTVLENITFEDEIMKEEVFGPILPIIEYSDLNEVIAKVNSGPKPLACYIFTKDANIKKKLLSEVSFGGGGINEAIMQISNSNLPFGGVGSSGMGALHGEFGFKEFSHYKGILSKATWIESNLKYAPYSIKKLKIIKWLMGQK